MGGAGGKEGQRELVLQGKEQSTFLETDGAGDKGVWMGEWTPGGLGGRRARPSGKRKKDRVQMGSFVRSDAGKGPSCPMSFYFLKDVSRRGLGCGRWRERCEELL